MDIETLPAGREMDAMVAQQVMGMAKYEVQATILGAVLPMGEHRPPIVPSIPAYSTDIAAAWLVVEIMRKKGFRFLLEVFLEPTLSATFWPYGNPVSRGLGDTMSLAICRSALQATNSP